MDNQNTNNQQNINIKVELEQKPQKVEVYQKEYFSGKKPLSRIKFDAILVISVIFIALVLYAISTV